MVIEPARVPSPPVKLASRPKARGSAVATQFAAEGRRAGDRLARQRVR